jgi:hypothetical protein
VQGDAQHAAENGQREEEKHDATLERVKLRFSPGSAALAMINGPADWNASVVVAQTFLCFTR